MTSYFRRGRLDVRWLITDIDGTITDSDGRIHLPAASELQHLERCGVPVGLATGRPYGIVRVLGEYLGLTGPLIAENGGVGYFRGRRFVLGSRRVAQDALALLSRSVALVPTWDNEIRLTDVALECGVDVAHIQTLLSNGGADVDIHESSIMIHIGKRGVTKRAALEHCADVAGLTPGDIAVAGDSNSDLSLFEGFPTSVAPANCTEELGKLARIRSNLLGGEGFCDGLAQLRRAGALPV